MQAAVYSRVYDPAQQAEWQLLFDEMEQQGIRPVIFRDFYDQLAGSVRMPDSALQFMSSKDLGEDIEFLISFGGDGTLLDTVSLIRDNKIILVGINAGRLGFLASIGREDIPGAIRAIVQRSYVEDRRTLIHLDGSQPLFGEVPYALNEFTIYKKDQGSMIKIHTYLNGEFLNTYWADGLIVATPTGSTGYSLSCQGPIVFPDSRSFVITPIAPHNLNVRPIVVPDTNVISFEIESRSDEVICSLDARREVISKNVQLAVRKETFDIGLLRLSEDNFLQTLRNKLTWGLDKRN
ncbi:MAG: NAD kinase [Bacteroidetes bacterium]|nr:NAD kinase [Bacteroidota bacterium]